MKVIFLDIDGVLNFHGSEARAPGGYVGIAEKCVKNLKQIIVETGAYLVLCSTWKDEWDKDEENCTPMGVYLNKKLKRHGLHIIDKTIDNTYNRGEGIHEWLSRHDNTESWIVLDDDIFPDYNKYNIMPHLVKTNFYVAGLEDQHIQKAIELLNGGMNEQ